MSTIVDMEPFRECVADVIESALFERWPANARAALVNDLMHELTLEAAKLASQPVESAPVLNPDCLGCPDCGGEW